MKERIIIKPYEPANWFTEAGAKKKLAALEAKGLPSFKNWRFITCTIDRKQFSGGAEQAYLYIKKRIRYFFRDLKNYLGCEIRFIWKLEFQQGGWAHWHILLDYTNKIDHNDLTRIWKYGFTLIRRVESNRLPYEFKYICKEVGELPPWFLNFKRPRCLQTSGIFASAPLDGKREESEDAPSSRPSSTLGERLHRYAETVQVKAGNKYVMTIRIGQRWMDWWLHLYNNFESHFVRFIDAYSVEIPVRYLMELQQEEYIHET